MAEAILQNSTAGEIVPKPAMANGGDLSAGQQIPAQSSAGQGSQQASQNDGAAQPAGQSSTTQHAVGTARTEEGDSETPEAAGWRWEALFMQTLSELITSAPQRGTRDGAASTLARLIVVSRKLTDGAGASTLYRQAYLAASMLKSSPDQSAAVSAIVEDIDFSSSRNSPIYTVMQGLARSVVYFFIGGVILLLLFALPYGLSYGLTAAAPTPVATGVGTALQTSLRFLSGPFIRTLLSPPAVAVVFGFLGSVVSILLRLSDFEGATRRSRQFLTITGSMLPLVGAIFAAVTCALFQSGIINFQFATYGAPPHDIDSISFYVVIGFLSGFSERFTRGLLGTAANTLTGGSDLRNGNQPNRKGGPDPKAGNPAGSSK